MTKQADGFGIEAVLERIQHTMTSNGHGFGELIFSIRNVGDPINASEVSIAVVYPGQSDKHPLYFPEGISTLKKDQSAVFNPKPSLTRGSGAVIVVTRNSDGKEITRASVSDLPK